jgi:hypothetical protein
MTYVIRCDAGLYTVGVNIVLYDGHAAYFEPIIDCATHEQALMMIHWLNGGNDPLNMPATITRKMLPEQDAEMIERENAKWAEKIPTLSRGDHQGEKPQ